MTGQRHRHAVAPVALTLLKHHVDELKHRLPGVPAGKRPRERPQHGGAGPEWLDVEAVSGEGLRLLGEQRPLARRQLERQRLQQALDLRRALLSPPPEAFVKHPLVRRVLVDQVHSVRTLGDDIGAAHLTDNAHHRQCLRRRSGDAGRLAVGRRAAGGRIGSCRGGHAHAVLPKQRRRRLR